MKTTTPSDGLFNVMKESLSRSTEKSSRRKGPGRNFPEKLSRPLDCGISRSSYA